MKTVINIKADKEVKEEAQRVAGEFGLSLSAVMNSYLRQFIRSRELYLSAIPQMTPELESLLKDVEKDISSGKNISPEFSNGEAMDDYLDSL
jgi:addiction module RelB/DinJ family antitoxin